MVAIFVNEKWFQSLPSEYRQDILRSGRIAAQVTRYLSRVNESIDLAYLRSKGMQVYAPTAEEKARFQAATREPVLRVLKESVDPALVDRVLEETAKAEKKLGY